MATRKRKSLIRHLINVIILLIIISIGYVFYTIVYDLRVRIINRSELNDLAKLNKGYALRFDNFVQDIEKETEWKVLIISGLRTKDEQIQLNRDNPLNASANKSRHVLGRALDINLYKRSVTGNIWLKKGSSKEFWRKTGVVEIATRYRLLWGGTYRNYHDPVHFEIN